MQVAHFQASQNGMIMVQLHWFTAFHGYWVNVTWLNEWCVGISWWFLFTQYRWNSSMVFIWSFVCPQCLQWVMPSSLLNDLIWDLPGEHFNAAVALSLWFVLWPMIPAAWHIQEFLLESVCQWELHYTTSCVYQLCSPMGKQTKVLFFGLSDSLLIYLSRR